MVLKIFRGKFEKISCKNLKTSKILNKFGKLLEISTKKLQRKIDFIDFGEIAGTAVCVKGILHKFEKQIFQEVFRKI